MRAERLEQEGKPLPPQHLYNIGERLLARAARYQDTIFDKKTGERKFCRDGGKGRRRG